MKKIYPHFLFIICFFISSLTINAQTFTVGSASGNYALNCNTTIVTMTTNSGYTPYSYTWTVPGNTLYGNYANISAPGTWTVIGQNVSTSATSQQTFAITQNLTTLTIAVTPTLYNTTCASGPGYFTLTCANQGNNVTTNWFQVINSNTVFVGVAQGTINVMYTGNPGIYWGEAVNNLTGCKSTKSVQVTAAVGVPIFTLTSPTNFSLGCGSSTITSIQVSNVITSPTPNAPVSYTFANPYGPAPTTFTVNPNKSGIIFPITYDVYVKDLTSNCINSQLISITQYTTQPLVYVSQPVSVLSCLQSTIVLTGVSNVTNSTMSWTVPPSSVVNSSTVAAITNSAIAGSTNNITSLGIYTLNVTDFNTQCVGTKTLLLNQDIRKPIFNLTALTNSVITCINPSVTIVPVITPTIAVALVPTFNWFAPSSTVGVAGSNFTTTSPGSHTAIATSAVNGCTTSASYLVAADLAVGATGGSVAISCPVTTAAISPTITTNPSAITFSWSGSPGSITSAVNQSSITINALGTYTCIITNTINGCTNTIYCTAVCNTGVLSYNSIGNDISVYPNPSKGAIIIELSTYDLNTKLTIFNVQGKLVFEGSLINKLNKVETNLTKGYYLYRITSEDQVLKKDKLIIE